MNRFITIALILTVTTLALPFSAAAQTPKSRQVERDLHIQISRIEVAQAHYLATARTLRAAKTRDRATIIRAARRTARARLAGERVVIEVADAIQTDAGGRIQTAARAVARVQKHFKAATSAWKRHRNVGSDALRRVARAQGASLPAQ